MKYEEYIKKLNTEDDSFEVGMLSDLKQEPPVNLHGEIMKAVNKERKKPAYLNYKLYAPLVAAALVIAVVINNHDIVKGTNLLKIFEGNKDKTIAANINPETNNDKADLVNGIIDTQQNTIAATTDQTPAKTQTTAPATSSTKTGVKDKLPSTTTEKVASNEPSGKSSSSTKVQGSDLSGLDNIIAVRDETVNYEILLDTPQKSVISFLTNKANCKQADPDDPNILVMNSDKFNAFSDLLSQNQINKVLLHRVTGENVVVKLIAVNYKIIADASLNDTVNLIKGCKGQYVTSNIYEISRNNYDALLKLMPTDVYTLKTVNDIYNDIVMVKLVPVNYELDLKGASDTITNYIKDTNNAQLVSDNIYTFSKDSFAAFGQLLSDAGIAKTTVNEASGGNIIVKINSN